MDKRTIETILRNIERVFIDENNFELRKSVEEIHDEDGNFLGDFVSFLMIDKKVTPPIFYSVVSPYDLISKKDPQHALVWQGGQLLLNTDYTDYAAMRTGAMDSIALKVSNVDTLKNKKILIFGTGRTARWSLRVLKGTFEDLTKIDYLNSTNTISSEFESFASELGVLTKVGTKENLMNYDIILCHTNTKKPILDIEEIKNIKDGAIITTFLGSDNEHGEVEDSYYNKDANIVLDWKNNLKLAKDILRSGTPESEIIFLKDLLLNKSSLDGKKNYTIFRFLGTPMQNLAVLQELSKR